MVEAVVPGTGRITLIHVPVIARGRIAAAAAAAAQKSAQGAAAAQERNEKDHDQRQAAHSSPVSLSAAGSAGSCTAAHGTCAKSASVKVHACSIFRDISLSAAWSVELSHLSYPPAIKKERKTISAITKCIGFRQQYIIKDSSVALLSL
jgi:hypothetical protein